MAGSSGGLSEEDIKRIAEAIRQGALPSLSNGLHVGDFLLGLIISVLLGGAVFFLLRSNAFRRFTRHQKAAAVEALKDMDQQTLKDILGDTELPSWISFPDFERVGWFNDIIAQLWPYVNQAVSAMARERLDPMLSESKPGWIRSIKLYRFDLGTKAPQANGVKVYKSEAVKDQVIVEMDFIWAGDQDVQLVVKPIPNIMLAPEAVSKAIGSLIQLRVGTEKLIVQGRVRLTLKPLMDELPIVGAIQVAFVESPHFSLSLTLYGGDISILPGLEAYLQNFVRDSILRPYVLPERFTIPMVDAQNFGIEMPQGMLFVKLIEATGVPRMDLLSKSDPYVSLHVRDKNIYKSQVKENNHHPVWNEEFKFLVHEPDYQALTMIMFDYDQFDPDDEIGRVSLPIKDFEEKKHHDLWVEVYDSAAEKEAQGHAKGKGVINGFMGTARNVKDITGHAIDQFEKNLPGEGRHKKCKIHVDVVFYRFKAQDLKGHHSRGEQGQLGDSDMEVATSEPDENDDVDAHEAAANARDALKGGVLYVKPKQAHNLRHKAFLKGRFLGMTSTVKVTVCGMTKHTVTSKGEDPLFGEALEFMLGAKDIHQDGAQVKIELWDYKLANSFQGSVTFALQEVMDKQRIQETYRLDGVGHGELDLEMRWLSVMEAMHGGAQGKGGSSQGQAHEE